VRSGLFTILTTGSGNIAFVAKTRSYLTQSLKGRDHLNELIVDGRIILKWFLKNMMGA
jgi:hypothetical protein